MSQMRRPSKGNSASVLILLLLVGASGLLFYAASNEEIATVELSSTATSTRSPEVEKIINKHLLSTNAKIELQRNRVEVENFKNSPQVGKRILQGDPRSSGTRVEMGLDRAEEQVHQRLNRDNPEVNYVSPAQRLQSELADQQRQAALEAKARQDYAEQFVENARRGGWEVELDENYVIRRVKKLPPDNKPRLFHQPSSSSSR